MKQRFPDLPVKGFFDLATTIFAFLYQVSWQEIALSGVDTFERCLL